MYGFTPPSSTCLANHVTAAQTPPHGYRSSVAYDPTQKLWITVGPNGTDISRDDGKNWTPLKPSGYDPPDADKNWNALSLPFVVGPHGRIGRLRPITTHQNKSANPRPMLHDRCLIVANVGFRSSLGIARQRDSITAAVAEA